MRLIERLKQVTSSKIEAFLSSMEDPELVLPQLLEELEGKTRVAAQAEAKAQAAAKSEQRRLDEVEGRIARLGKGAELALGQGDEATAKEALQAQVQAEKDAKVHREALEKTESALEDARQARVQLETQLQDLTARKDEIIARARRGKQRKATVERVAKQGGSTQSLLDQIAQAEARLEEEEAELQIKRELGSEQRPPLDARLRELERQAEIDKRMERLRKKDG